MQGRKKWKEGKAVIVWGAWQQNETVIFKDCAAHTVTSAEKTEIKKKKKKKWPVLQLHNHFSGPFYWWVQLLNESSPSLDFLPFSKVNWLYICSYTFLNLLSFTLLSMY